MSGSDQLVPLDFESLAGGSISKRSGPTPMPRWRVRSYAHSLSGMVLHRAGTMTAPFSIGTTRRLISAMLTTAALEFRAWNAPFDRAIWNYSTLGFPFHDARTIIDRDGAGRVSNLPTDLKVRRAPLAAPASKRTARADQAVLRGRCRAQCAPRRLAALPRLCAPRRRGNA